MTHHRESYQLFLDQPRIQASSAQDKERDLVVVGWEGQILILSQPTCNSCTRTWILEAVAWLMVNTSGPRPGGSLCRTSGQSLTGQDFIHSSPYHPWNNRTGAENLSLNVSIHPVPPGTSIFVTVLTSGDFFWIVWERASSSLRKRKPMNLPSVLGFICVQWGGGKRETHVYPGALMGRNHSWVYLQERATARRAPREKCSLWEH